MPGHVIVMPGNTGEPNVLMVQSEAPKPVNASQAEPNCSGGKRLAYRAVRLLANESESFRDAQIRPDDLRVAERDHLAACVEMLRKASDRGIRKRSGGRIVLVVILGRKRVSRVGVPIQIGDGLVGDEICCAGNFRVLRESLDQRRIRGIQGDRVGIRGGNQILPAGQLVIEKRVRNRIDVARPEAHRRIDRSIGQAENAREVVVVSHGCKRRSRAIIGESGRDGRPRDSDFVVGRVRVLIAAIKEELVFYDRQAHGAARRVAVQAGIFFILRNIRVGIVEIRGGVEPVRSAMAVELPVNVVRARGRAQVDVSAAGRSLFGVVHRSVHAHFLNGFGRRRGDRLADREVYGRAALHRERAEG